MNTPTFENTDQIYDCSINASIRWQSIKYKEFQTFTHVVQDLVDSIGELDNDDDWFVLVKRIRGFRFNALAAPLSEKFLQTQLRELIDWLHANKIRFSYSHPNALEKYSQLLTISEGLSKIKISQLLIALSKELSQPKYQNGTLVLVCEPRLVRDTEKALSSVGFSHLEVASPTFLREDTTYKNIIVMGPTRWYPDYIFTAPKGENILVFKYEWIRDRWKHENVFTAPFKQRASKLMQTTINEPVDSLSLEPEMALSTAFNFKYFQKHVTDENRGHNEVDYVQSRLFLLEEDWVVLLDANEASSVLVIDLRDSDSPVKKIKVSEIEAGMYVLLRTTGGGDFIVPVADRIMGESGITAR